MMENKKSDYQTRFQNNSFRKQLRVAREYKRTSRKPPEKPFEVFLDSIGLNSWWKKILAAIILAGFVYLIYFPNFLTVREIRVNGLKAADAELLSGQVKASTEKKSLWPQYNLLLLSKKRVNSLVAGNEKVLKVNSIKKQFPHILQINVEPRVEQYVLESVGGLYLVSSDGKILSTDESLTTASTSPYSNLIVIKYTGENRLEQGSNFLSAEVLNILRESRLKLADTTKSPIAFFEIEEPNPQEIYVYTQTGYKIIFDVKLSIDESLEHLKQLLGQIADADQKNLLYIDLRFKNKGFVCFKSAPCSVPLEKVLKDAPTSTPDSELNASSTPIK